MPEYSRKEFYNLVWSKPITELAKEFGLSDVALHKVCREHDIPHPKRGWWAKKSAGKTVQQTPLPKAKYGIEPKINIVARELRTEPDLLKLAREEARTLVAMAGTADSVEPNPIVARTMGKLRKANVNERGLLSVSGRGLISCSVSEQSIDRLSKILDQVIYAAGRQKFILTSAKDGAVFSGPETTISVSVMESVKRVKHELSESELAEREKFRKERDRRFARNDFDWDFIDHMHFPKWDYHPTGLLSIDLEDFYLDMAFRPRRAFRDAKIQRLDNMAEEVAVGIAVLAAAKIEKKKRDEERERLQLEKRREDERVERNQYINNRRTNALDKILLEQEQIERMKTLIGSLLSDGKHENDRRVAEFLKFAQEALEHKISSLQPRQLQKRFESDHLFGDDDDTGFEPSRRPYWDR